MQYSHNTKMMKFMQIYDYRYHNHKLIQKKPIHNIEVDAFISIT
jgi:hypothetical protein